MDRILRMDLFNLISAPNPVKVKTGTRPHTAHEVLLLTATDNRVIDMEDTMGASGSSETPSTMEKSPLDFADEDLPPPNTEGVVLEPDLEQEVVAIGPLVDKRRRKRGNDKANANAPPKVLRKDHLAFRPAQSTIGGKSLAIIGKAASSAITPATQDTPAGASSVKDPDPLSYAEPLPIPEQDIAQSSKKTIVAEDPDSERSTSFTSMGGSPGSVYQPGWGVTNNCRLDTPDVCQDIKAAFEEFKKYEDDRVEQRCTEMDARLDKLSVDFDEELYPHMLTAIVGRRWVIRHGMRLAIMKCGETLELRQAFENVVSAGLVKGMSEDLEHGIEHGKAGRDLEVVEAYDSEAHSKYLKALQELKDLKYPLVDQLECLKDAHMELIMASLHLESDSGEDAPQWIRDLRPSISQLKIHVYPVVRDPRNPWAIKEDILLEDAIAAKVSRTEKKKKCRVVCRTHGVDSAHHARSDGVLVSAHIVAPQGLAILLADASTQTEISEGEASPRLLRSMSLPAMYNLDWP
ncbi:hypothetical protein Tco_1255115 [Tanacetum coccineum]